MVKNKNPRNFKKGGRTSPTLDVVSFTTSVLVMIYMVKHPLLFWRLRPSASTNRPEWGGYHMLQPGQLYGHHLLYGDRPPGWAEPRGGPGLQSVCQLHGRNSGEGTSQNVHHRHCSKWFVLQLLSLCQIVLAINILHHFKKCLFLNVILLYWITGTVYVVGLKGMLIARWDVLDGLCEKWVCFEKNCRL